MPEAARLGYPGNHRHNHTVLTRSKPGGRGMAEDRRQGEERLMQWLRDAQAMEAQAETMLTGMETRIEHYPHLRKRIAQHLKETQHQAQRLADAIGRLGGKAAAGPGVMAPAMPGGLAGDAVVADLLAGYTFEHYEIGAYRILITAALALDDGETARILRENLREEEDMAQWLSSNFDSLTAEFLERDGHGSERVKR
jgi:ferritin-like metal-binding protein YciE